MLAQRIVSLLPSATETLFALGLGDQIVGVSHECDFPPAARGRTAVIRSRIPQGSSAQEIDRLVGEFSARGESIYAIDAAALRRLAPDLIITQELCQVCAASPEDLSAVLETLDPRPELLSLNPRDLGDVWRDILWLGEQTFRGHEAERLLESIGEKLAAIDREVAETVCRPRSVFLEWLEPPYVGGHWVPEMTELAGGIDALARPRQPSFRVTFEEIIAAQPDILVVAPCGYSADHAIREYRSLSFPRAWQEIPAIRNRQIFAVEANSYFSRPGPRLVTGLEILGKIYHPGINVSREAEHAIHALFTSSEAATV